MKKLIVIPARGGSKGIPHKNIYPLNGKPLLEYTIELAIKADLPNTDIVLSTDSEAIMDVARKYEKVIIVERPAEISGDMASTEAALLHSLEYMKSVYGKTYDAIITLQATSPLRKVDTFIKFVNEYEAKCNQYDAMLSLNENKSDFWHEIFDGQYERLFRDAPRRRQDRKPLYMENSAYYITDVDALKQTGSVLGKSVNGFIISDIEAIDINEIIDIYIAEGIMRATSETE